MDTGTLLQSFQQEIQSWLTVFLLINSTSHISVSAFACFLQAFYLPAQAKALQESAPRTESSVFSQAGWMAPGSPGRSESRVLLCQSLCKVFCQSAMPQNLSPSLDPVPCLNPAKANSWAFVLQWRKDSYFPESLKITYSMLQIQTERPAM